MSSLSSLSNGVAPSSSAVRGPRVSLPIRTATRTPVVAPRRGGGANTRQPGNTHQGQAKHGSLTNRAAYLPPTVSGSHAYKASERQFHMQSGRYVNTRVNHNPSVEQTPAMLKHSTAAEIQSYLAFYSTIVQPRSAVHVTTAPTPAAPRADVRSSRAAILAAGTTPYTHIDHSFIASHKALQHEMARQAAKRDRRKGSNASETSTAATAATMQPIGVLPPPPAETTFVSSNMQSPGALKRRIEWQDTLRHDQEADVEALKRHADAPARSPANGVANHHTSPSPPTNNLPYLRPEPVVNPFLTPFAPTSHPASPQPQQTRTLPPPSLAGAMSPLSPRSLATAQFAAASQFGFTQSQSSRLPPARAFFAAPMMPFQPTSPATARQAPTVSPAPVRQAAPVQRSELERTKALLAQSFKPGAPKDADVGRTREVAATQSTVPAGKSPSHSLAAVIVSPPASSLKSTHTKSSSSTTLSPAAAGAAGTESPTAAAVKSVLPPSPFAVVQTPAPVPLTPEQKLVVEAYKLRKAEAKRLAQKEKDRIESERKKRANEELRERMRTEQERAEERRLTEMKAFRTAQLEQRNKDARAAEAKAKRKAEMREKHMSRSAGEIERLAGTRLSEEEILSPVDPLVRLCKKGDTVSFQKELARTWREFQVQERIKSESNLREAQRLEAARKARLAREIQEVLDAAEARRERAQQIVDGENAAEKAWSDSEEDQSPDPGPAGAIGLHQDTKSASSVESISAAKDKKALSPAAAAANQPSPAPLPTAHVRRTSTIVSNTANKTDYLKHLAEAQEVAKKAAAAASSSSGRVTPAQSSSDSPSVSTSAADSKSTAPAPDVLAWQRFSAFLERRDPNGSTILAHAIWKQQVGLVNLLLNLGAKMDGQDHLRNTPLHLACQRGLDAVIDDLTARGARLDLPNTQNKLAWELPSVSYELKEIVRIANVVLKSAGLNTRSERSAAAASATKTCYVEADLEPLEAFVTRKTLQLLDQENERARAAAAATTSSSVAASGRNSPSAATSRSIGASDSDVAPQQSPRAANRSTNRASMSFMPSEATAVSSPRAGRRTSSSVSWKTPPTTKRDGVTGEDADGRPIAALDRQKTAVRSPAAAAAAATPVEAAPAAVPSAVPAVAPVEGAPAPKKRVAIKIRRAGDMPAETAGPIAGEPVSVTAASAVSPAPAAPAGPFAPVPPSAPAPSVAAVIPAPSVEPPPAAAAEHAIPLDAMSF